MAQVQPLLNSLASPQELPVYSASYSLFLPVYLHLFSYF